MAGVNVLIIVGSAQGAPGTRYLSFVKAEVDGNLYTACMPSFPEISLALSHPRGGVQSAGDTLAFDFKNVDGALSDWLDGTNDPRGYSLKAYYRPFGVDDDDAPTLFFEGFVSDVWQSVGGDGVVMVRLEASSQAADKFANPLPSVVIESRTFNDAGEEDLVPEESLGFPVPAIYGATREHVPLVPIRREPNEALWRYVAMHDGREEFLSGRVNTIYRQNSLTQRLGVVPRSEWNQSQVEYAEVTDVRPARDVVVVDFPYSQDSSLYYDGEVTEFDTKNSSVKRHWLFRGSLIDEKASAALNSQSADALADWNFEYDLTDSSGNGHDLTADFVEASLVYAEDPRDLKVSIITTPETRVALRPTANDPSEFNYSKSTTFRIEVELRPLASGDGWGVDGVLAHKSDGSTNGYILRAREGFVTFQLLSSTGSVMVSAKKKVKGERPTTVMAYVDAAGGKIGLAINGILQEEASTAAIGDDPASATVLHLLATAGHDEGARGYFGRIQIFTSLQSDDYEWLNGQSNTVESAVKLAAGVTGLREYAATASECDYGATSNMTLLAWIKRRDATPVNERIIGKRDGTDAGWSLQVQDSKVEIVVSDGTDTVTATSTTSVDADDDWHLVIATLRRSTGILSIYVDGELEATADAGAVGDMSNIEDLNSTYHGSIDEIVVAKTTSPSPPMAASQIRTYYQLATSNPAGTIRRIVSNVPWGLGLSVDSTSFDAVAVAMAARGLKFNGGLYEARTAMDVLSEMLASYGLTLRMTSDAWGLFWFDAMGDGAEEKHGGYLDGLWNNVKEVTSHRRLPAKDIPSRLACRYQRLNDPNHPTRVFMMQTIGRDVSATATGKPLKVMLPHVRDANTADRIADYLAKWSANDEQLAIVADYELVTVALGHGFWFSAPRLGLSTERKFKVIGKRLRADSIAFNLIEDVDTSEYDAELLWPDLVPQDRPDYRYTEPPPPEDLHLIVNDTHTQGAKVGIKWTMPEDEITRAIVQRCLVSWRYTDTTNSETDEFEWLSLPCNVVAGETKIAYLRLEAGRQVEVRVQAKSTFDLLSANALTVAAGLTTEGGQNLLAFETADDAMAVLEGNTGLARRLGFLESGTVGPTPRPFVRELFYAGNYTDGQVVDSIPFDGDPLPHSFPADLVGSLFKAKSAPLVSDATVTFRQDGVDVATITFVVGYDPVTNTPAPTVVSAGWSGNAGDFEVVMPSPANSGFGGFSALLIGARIDGDWSSVLGGPLMLPVDDTGFNGSTTHFAGRLPFDWDDTRDSVFLLQDGIGVAYRVAATPEANQFVLSGTGNKDIDFGTAPDAGNILYAIRMPKI